MKKGSGGRIGRVPAEVSIRGDRCEFLGAWERHPPPLLPLGGLTHRRAELAAHAKALHRPKYGQEHRGGHTDAAVHGEAANENLQASMSLGVSLSDVGRQPMRTCGRQHQPNGCGFENRCIGRHGWSDQPPLHLGRM